MIASKNYAAQAVSATNKAISQLLYSGNRGVELLREFSKKALAAQHFATPDNGVIFDDNLKGIIGSEVKLPYPLITVEYRLGDTKVCTLAEQSDSEVRFLFAFCNPNADWDVFASRAFFNGSVEDENIQVEFDTEFGEPSLEAKQYATLSVLRVLELCEALSCSNISHEPIEEINPAVNARRVRDGKLPFYETRILVVDTKNPSSTVEKQTGTHQSPRQHLRRGHIRRLPSANIWVNSCVVGSSKNGVINKDYFIK